MYKTEIHPHHIHSYEVLTSSEKFRHMFHDERFWGVVALLLLIGFIFLAVWLSPNEVTEPPSTFYRYLY